MLTDNETFRKTLLCFENAVHDLAVGEGDLKSRIINASRKIYRVKREDLPIDELREDYDWINEQFTSKEPIRGEKGNVISGQLEESLYKKRSSTLQLIAERIVAVRDRMIYLEIDELKEKIDERRSPKM